jgi:hypothetical protein
MAARGEAGISANAQHALFDHFGHARKSRGLSDRSPLPLHYTPAHRQSAAAAELFMGRALAMRSFSIFSRS